MANCNTCNDTGFIKVDNGSHVKCTCIIARLQTVEYRQNIMLRACGVLLKNFGAFVPKNQAFDDLVKEINK